MEIETAIQSLGTLSYGGIFILGLMVNFVIPIPEEIILVLLGYIASTGAFEIWIIAPILVSGMIISDMVLFHVSHRGSKYIQKLKKKIQNNRLLRDDTFVRNHIKKIIFVSRFITHFRFIGPVLSGSIKTKWQTFFIYDILALCIYVTGWLFLGDYFHGRIQTIIAGVGVFRNIIFIVIIAIAIIFIFRFINKRFLQSITTQANEYTPVWIKGLYMREIKEKKHEDYQAFEQ